MKTKKIKKYILQANYMINIDKSAGFCWGVVKTIEKVEDTLQRNPNRKVYVIGEIIHNPHEINRLKEKNLKITSLEQLKEISESKPIVVIRAHGEPPATYETLAKLGITLVDATCHLVKRLQNRILEYYQNDWQIIIFGKNDHAEVIGLRGCCNDKCFVCLKIDDIANKIDYNKKTILFSQTTMNIKDFNLLFEQLCDKFENNNAGKNLNGIVNIENTVCKFMINREEKLKQFAKKNDFIFFVAGRNSSNGKVLFEICKSENINTLFIESLYEIDKNTLNNIVKNNKNIGITGSTSTPMWYLEDIQQKLLMHFNSNS